MTLIKICGITNKVDALAAADLGADMLGFVFYGPSARYVPPSVAEDIINELPPSVASIGVFVDEKAEDVLRIAEDAGLSGLQFHGDETPGYCALFKGKYPVIKAFRVRTQADLKAVNDYPVDYLLFDAYAEGTKGGTGTAFDWKVLKDFELLKPVIVSGGLTPDTVGRAISELAPYGVDVSSGIEQAPGKKDHALLKRFILNVRKSQ